MKKGKLLFLVILSSLITTAYAEEIDENAILSAGAQKKIEEDVQVFDSVEYILERYDLSYDEFLVICAVVMGEAKENDYQDAYAVINTIYNRTNSNRWVNYVSNCMNLDGKSLYTQVICVGQFEVYHNGRYKKFLGLTDSPAYNAIVDFLVSENVMHDYLSFVASSSKDYEKVQFVDRGNRYYNVLDSEDRIGRRR